MSPRTLSTYTQLASVFKGRKDRPAGCPGRYRAILTQSCELDKEPHKKQTFQKGGERTSGWGHKSRSGPRPFGIVWTAPAILVVLPVPQRVKLNTEKLA